MLNLSCSVEATYGQVTNTEIIKTREMFRGKKIEIVHGTAKEAIGKKKLHKSQGKK